MDYIEAKRIIVDYGSVVKRIAGSGGTTAHPISCLPHSKDEIKTAIKTALVTLAIKGELTDHLKNGLHLGFLTLASFIDDEQAEIYKEFDKWVREGAKARTEDTNALKSHLISWHYEFDMVPEISKQMEQEAETMLQELNELEGSPARTP